MKSLRSFWNDVPAVRLLLPYIAGVISAISLLHFVFSPEKIIAHFLGLMIVLSVGLLVSIAVVFVGYRQKNTIVYYQRRYLWGGGTFMAMYFLGSLMLLLHTAVFYKNHFINQPTKEGVFVVKVVAPPIRKEKTTFLKTEFLENQQGETVSGFLQLMMPTDSFSQRLQYGDVLAFSGKPELLDRPKNPYEFDYAQFQHFRNIYYRIYVSENQLKLLKSNTGNPLLAAVYRLRNYFLTIINTHIPTKDERSVAGAILIGYRDDMSQDIVQAYSSSGALHVMSVSGLHVGIIYLALQFMLGWMDKRPRLKTLKAMLLISAMAFYALLTGLAPSVMRAVVMFSFFVVGKAMKRDTNMFNILAVSCLGLLLYNPYLITEVGFKLSYLAVLGIVIFYPIIHQLWIPKQKTLKFLWSITAMSIAAQLATFPVSLYYFHQFPVLFIISNLVVIPVSNALIYIGMLLFAVGKIVWLSKWVGLVLYYAIYYLNQFIYFIEKMPNSLIEEIHISQAEMYFMYLLFGGCLLVYYLPKARYIITTLCVLVGFSAIRANRIFKNKNQQLMVIYNAPKQSALAWVQHQNVVIDMDSTLTKNRSQMLFHVLHHWWALGIKNKAMIDSNTYPQKLTTSFGYFTQFGDKRIAKITMPFKNYLSADSLKINYVILSQSPKIAISTVFQTFHPEKIIFDSSNKPWRTKQWRAACDSLKIPYYDVADYAFVIDVKGR